MVQLNDFLQKLPRNGFADYVKQTNYNKQDISFNKDEYLQLLKKVFDTIDKDKLTQALDWLFLVTWLDKDESLKNLRKHKTLSIFSYLNHKNHVPRVISSLLENADFLGFDLNELQYLHSLKNLSSLYGVVKNKRASVLAHIRKRKKTLIKSLYSYIDKVFQGSKTMGLSHPSDTPNLFTPEQGAEAVSYIIVEYRDLYGVEDGDILLSDVAFVIGDEIEKLLMDACHIKLVHEYEVLIESLGYRCEAQGETLHIHPSSPEFSKSWSLGNILLEMNRIGDKFYNKDVASIVELAKKFNEATKNYILNWDAASNRYMIVMNEGHLPLIHSKEYLIADRLFREEIDFLREVEDLLLLRYDQLKEFEIVAGFTFYDLLLIKRVLTFLSIAYFDLLEKQEEKHYHSSNIPFWGSKTIKKILAPAIGEAKTELFFKTFSFGNTFQGTLDIQYTPLLKGDDYYIVPLNVVINSNLFRNILYPLGKRIYREGVDPISEMLSSSLQKKGFLVKTNYKYKYQGAHSDMDVIAIKGNNIFLFECKNSVLPVNPYEMRGSFRELKKAAEKQLPLAVAACRDKEFLKNYGLKIESENEDIKIYASIVTTYKLLSGFAINGFQIRNVKNLCEFIDTGTFGVGNEKNGNCIYSMWKNETFSVDDLIAYLNPNHFYYQMFMDSMKEKVLWNKMNDINVYESHYEIDLDEYGERLDSLKLRQVRKIAEG